MLSDYPSKFSEKPIPTSGGEVKQPQSEFWAIEWHNLRTLTTGAQSETKRIRLRMLTSHQILIKGISSASMCRSRWHFEEVIQENLLCWSNNKSKTCKSLGPENRVWKSLTANWWVLSQLHGLDARVAPTSRPWSFRQKPSRTNAVPSLTASFMSSQMWKKLMLLYEQPEKVLWGPLLRGQMMKPFN